MEFKDVEQFRQVYAKKLKIFITIGFIFFFLGIFAFIASFISRGISSIDGIITLSGIGLFALVVVIIIGIIVTRKDAKNYQSAYKAYFVERNLRQIFTDVSYHHDMGISKEVLKSTDMIRTGDVYKSNDFTSGKYKDVAFAQADVEIQEEHSDSDGNTTYVTIFKGRWMVFEFPKPFTFRMEVVEKWFNASKKFAKNRETKRKITKISTESITFDKKFKVYAEDGFEAYYILDPAFIDQIEKLSESHKGKLLLCFIDNKLHVAINDNNDAFEPPNPLKAIDEQTESQKIFQDIKTVTDFIDFLKLDRKIFKN